MGVQKCEKCHSLFSWSKIFKSLWLGYRPVQCRQCGVKHRISFFSRILLSLLTVIPMFLFGSTLINKWSLSIPYIVSLMIIYGVLLSALFPYLAKYNSNEGSY